MTDSAEVEARPRAAAWRRRPSLSWPFARARQRRAPVPPALAGMDEFIARIRPYVAVRLEDNLLIRMPNQAHRLNPAGAGMLHFLLEGGTVAELADAVGDDPERLRDVALFLHEIRRCLSGELREDNASRAVEIVPLETPFSVLPVLSEVALTARCNLRCGFCYAGCADGLPPGRCAASAGPAPARIPRHESEMSTRDVQQILQRIRGEAGVPSVSFTGGEPTLRPDLAGLVRFAARDLGMRVNLITNGTRITSRLAKTLAAAGLASAQVSIEGPDAGIHDAVTGVPGSFARSCRAVAHLQDRGVTVHGNTTIHRQNLPFVAAMPAFTRDVLHCDRLSMNMVIPAGTAGRNGSRADSTLLRYTEIAPVVLTVQQAAEEADVEFMWYSPTPLCLFNPILANLGNKGCSACDGLLSVDYRGQILPCSACDDPIGSLLQDEFRPLWNRASALHYREKGFAHPGCRACEHFAFCHGACPLYWRHFGFGELEEARGFSPGVPPRMPRPVDSPRDTPAFGEASPHRETAP